MTLAYYRNYIWSLGDNTYYNPSFASDELIEELEQDIAEFGEDEPCWLFWEVRNFDFPMLVCVNYDFICDEQPLTTEEIGNCLIQKSTFGEVLEILKIQDKIC